MGLARVFSRSIRFAFRTKIRFFVFLLIFGIVSTIIAFNIDSLDDLQTVDLLEQKGVRAYRSEGANITYTQGNNLVNDVIAFAEDAEDTALDTYAGYYFLDVDADLRINSIDIDNPWLSDFANPGLLESGRYPEAVDEILVPEGSYQHRTFNTTSGSVVIETKLTTGQELTFVSHNDIEIVLTVVGTLDISEHRIENKNDQVWLFVDNEMFADLLPLFDYEVEDSWTYMVSFVVEGLILQDSTYKRVDVLNEQINILLDDEAKYGDFIDVPTSSPSQQTTQKSDEILTLLGFVVAGGIILSVLFAYLLSRFRRREIAILKAMGYSNSSVRTALYGELLTVAFLGFVVGLGIAQTILLTGPNGLEFDNFIRAQAVGVAFVIMVVISLPGMFIASRRVLGISPAEAFRDK